MSKARHMLSGKVCKVCGDKALGHNFNVVTCESCKAFFRRNASKDKVVKCPFEGSCTIDVVTRRFCQSCRLKKCFDVGMKKEWILTDEEKQRKRSKIEENRAKRSVSDKRTKYASMSEDSLSPMQCSPDSASSTQSGNGVPEITSASMFMSNYDFLKDIRMNGEHSNYGYSNFVEAAFTPNILNEKPNRGSHCCTTGYTDDSDHTQLNRLETDKLNELIVANEILKQPLSDKSVDDPQGSNLLDVVKMTDYAVRRIIKMAKKLEGFRLLCEDDQVALLKGSCTEMLVLRSVMHYSVENDSWQDINNNLVLKLDVLKLARGNIYESHMNFIKSFDERCRKDEKVMLLLCAIALFTPDRVNVQHKEVIRYERHLYMYLLKRYLESTLPSYCEATTAYVHLMEKIDQLRTINENQIRLFLQIDPNVAGPLLIEILDLKF